MAEVILIIDTTPAVVALHELSSLLEAIEILDVDLDAGFAGRAGEVRMVVKPSERFLELMTAIRAGDIKLLRSEVSRHSLVSDSVDRSIVGAIGAGVDLIPAAGPGEAGSGG